MSSEERERSHLVRQTQEKHLSQRQASERLGIGVRQFKRLVRSWKQQVEAGLHRYAMTGQGDVKALQGRDGYRLRIGSYRVIFDEDATTILAIYIGRRTTTTYRRS